MGLDYTCTCKLSKLVWNQERIPGSQVWPDPAQVVLGTWKMNQLLIALSLSSFLLFFPFKEDENNILKENLHSFEKFLPPVYLDSPGCCYQVVLFF